MAAPAIQLPYRAQLAQPFLPGMTMAIRGATIKESKVFECNLLAGDAEISPLTNVPLHLKVKLDDKKIILNTAEKGEWGKEERHSSPIKTDQVFDIRIRAHDQKFEIYVNNHKLTEYEHRQALSTVTHFSVSGDVYLNHVGWSGKYVPVPYETSLVQGLPVGKKLLISGIPEKKAKEFEIVLLGGGNRLLSFKPNFSDKAVIRNAEIDGVWGNVEKVGTFGFEKEVLFDLIIENEKSLFQIYKDGVTFGGFAHRSDPNGVTALEINGDIEITDVQIV